MFNKVIKAINKYNMITDNDHIITGLSGGSDSVALLHVLKTYAQIKDFSVTAVHINHNLRGAEALRDENLSVNLCRNLDIPIQVYSIQVDNYAAKHKMTLEEAGRHVRYNCFNDTLKKENGTRIAVAHNHNDHIETVLMNFFRGSGLSGLSGIAPVRANIIRPLINCTKEEILQYCNENGLEYADDSTNSTTDFIRNKVRLELLPYLKKEINQGVENNIHRLSMLSQSDSAFIKEEAEKTYYSCAEISKNKIAIDLEKFKRCHQAIQRRLIRMAFDNLTGCLKDFTLKHVDSVLGLTEKNTGKSVHLPNKIKAAISYNKLIIKKEQDHKRIDIKLYAGCFENIPDTPYFISCSVDNPIEKENYTNTCTGVFNYDKILDKLFLRNRIPGDKIYLKSVNGNKKIKDYFIDNKIDRDKRDAILMIADDKNNILWLLDDKKFISDKYKYTPGNKKIYIQLWRDNNEQHRSID